MNKEEQKKTVQKTTSKKNPPESCNEENGTKKNGISEHGAKSGEKQEKDKHKAETKGPADGDKHPFGYCFAGCLFCIAYRNKNCETVAARKELF